MKLQTILILILCAGLLVSLFFNVDDRETIQSLKLEKERDKKALDHKDSYIRQLIDSVHKQDLAWLKVTQAEKIRGDRLEEKLTIANERLTKIRFVGFGSDTSARAGAIRDLYPSYVRP